MLLLEQFDANQHAVIDPEMEVKPIENFPEITISIFSKKLFDTMLSFFEPKVLATLHSAIGNTYIYEVVYQGERFAFYQSLVGEPISIVLYEQIIVLGSKQLILLGNCGVLDRNIKDCGIIIPTKAIRDEGSSYHYAPASDYINVNHQYIDLFKEVLEEKGYPFVEGITWTTDAPYRETRDKVQKRKEQGAICVEMECAGMQALCDFRNTGFFQFFYAGDNLDHSTWDPRSVAGNVRVDDKCKIALLAFELGLKIKASK